MKIQVTMENIFNLNNYRMYKTRLTAALLLLFSQQILALQPPVKDPELSRCIEEHMSRLVTKEATAVLELQCSNRRILSTEGLEQFTQLQTLNLFNNRLEHFSAIPLSKLVSLNLAGNRLSSLSLMNFPQLQTLLVFNNQLQTLTLNNLPELTSLKGNGNQLVEWHYVHLPKLEKVMLFNNKMPTIDIYHLPALKIMDVRQNPMPDPLYDAMNKMTGVTFMHDGNAPDWK